MSVKKITGREFTLNVLNGISMGVVVSLIPGALLGQLMQALAKIWPTFAHAVLDITTFNMSLLPAMAGFSVGYLFKMNMVQMSSIAGAAMVGSGVIVKTQQGFGLAGTGDVINVGVTIVFSVLLAWLIGNKFKNYTTTYFDGGLNGERVCCVDLFADQFSGDRSCDRDHGDRLGIC